jgi:TATA-binding protein-associated factor
VKHATVADIARLEGVSPEQAVERAAHLKPTSEEEDDAAGDLAFAEFDIVGVLERAAPLLAAKSGDDALFGGAENDVRTTPRSSSAKPSGFGSPSRP